jgi:hypothetical protein
MGFLDRLPRFPLLADFGFGGHRSLLFALLGELLRDRVTGKSDDPAEKCEGKHRHTRHDGHN